jgi:hypothetical protein
MTISFSRQTLPHGAMKHNLLTYHNILISMKYLNWLITKNKKCTVCHNYSSKKQHVPQKNYSISRCEKITRYSKGGDISLVLHMVTITKRAEVVELSKLPPCVAKHVWGDSGKRSEATMNWPSSGSEWDHWQ